MCHEYSRYYNNWQSFPLRGQNLIVVLTCAVHVCMSGVCFLQEYKLLVCLSGCHTEHWPAHDTVWTDAMRIDIRLFGVDESAGACVHNIDAQESLLRELRPCEIEAYMLWVQPEP